jgi:hypothetical protein
MNVGVVFAGRCKFYEQSRLSWGGCSRDPAASTDSSIEIYERLNQSFFTTQKNVLVASKDFQRSLCTVVLIPT